MKVNDIYYPSADGMTRIHAMRWEPEDEPKAVVQIVHGMTEYIGRYAGFAEDLTKQGYLVTGEDHLGHGESVASDDCYGFFGEKGNEWIIADIHTLRKKTAAENPGKPYFLLGHSMGSFLTRQYLTEQNSAFAEGIAGAVIMGTCWQPAIALKAGKLLASMYGLKKKGKTCKLVEIMAFKDYFKRIENPATISDWLSRDPELIRNYRHDSWCSFRFTPNGYYHMFAGMEKAHDTGRMKTLPEGLPLLFASGEEDPVGGWGEGVKKAVQVYSDCTRCEVEMVLYPDDRHEILNEPDKEQVRRDMIDFFDRHCL